jgi:hypothetical protein
MAKYRNKPNPIDAIKFTGSNYVDINEFVGKPVTVISGENILQIETFRGNQTVMPGWYIVKQRDGEFYIFEPTLFEYQYELVEG